MVLTKEAVVPRMRCKPQEAMELTGAQILWECLVEAGVEVVFGYPGGYVLPLYDELPNYAIRHVLVRHEQAAAHAADGYARATGRIGVCLATSGPGATNLVSGIANAYLDSSPLLAITGQVPTWNIGKNSFQEVNITSIVQSITKRRYQVGRVEDLATTMHTAIREACAGRPGPVLVDIPKNVLLGRSVFARSNGSGNGQAHGDHRQAVFDGELGGALELLTSAERPVIVAGHGVILSGAYAELRELAESGSIPVATTLLGISSFPESHPLSLGMVGMHGTTCANKAVDEADVLIALGMRFDDRVTGNPETFAPTARIIHVDIDAEEIGKNVRVDVPIVGDVRHVLRAINASALSIRRPAWLKRVAEWREKYSSRAVRPSDELLPQYVIDQLYRASCGQATVVSDVGQNQMWAAMHYWYDRPNTLLSSGGLGCMGFSLPAAIGAQIGRPHEQVWVVCGDGGIQMNIQELATLVQEGLPVKIVILNNGYLGMVRQWQELFYERRYVAAKVSPPDFVSLAQSYGVAAFRVDEKRAVRATIEQAIDHDGPALIEFVVSPEEGAYPMVPPDGGVADTLEGSYGARPQA